MTRNSKGVLECWIDGKKVPTDRQVLMDGTVIILNDEGNPELELNLDVGQDGASPRRDPSAPESMLMDSFQTLQSKQGEQPRKAIGVNITPISPALAAQLELDEDAALLIVEVLADMPAARAGLKRYDVIVSIDGKRPVTSAKLHEAVAAVKKGGSLVLEVRRAGRSMEFEVGVDSISPAKNRLKHPGRVRPWVDLPAEIQGIVLPGEQDAELEEFFKLRGILDPLRSRTDSSELIQRIEKLQQHLAKIEELNREQLKLLDRVLNERKR